MRMTGKPFWVASEVVVGSLVRGGTADSEQPGCFGDRENLRRLVSRTSGAALDCMHAYVSAGASCPLRTDFLKKVRTRSDATVVGRSRLQRRSHASGALLDLWDQLGRHIAWSVRRRTWSPSADRPARGDVFVGGLTHLPMLTDHADGWQLLLATREPLVWVVTGCAPARSSAGRATVIATVILSVSRRAAKLGNSRQGLVAC